MELSFDREPIAHLGLSVVIPAYRSAALLPEVVEAFTQLLASRSAPSEIIVVDDASGDETAERLGEWSARWPNAKFIRHDEHLGHGAALRTGILNAQHPMVFTFPAIAGFEPADIKSFLEAIDEVDIVCGVRPGRNRWQWWKDAFPSCWLLGVNVSDPRCPVRLYRRSIFERWNIQSKSAFAHVEILAKANFLTSLMNEVPVRGPAQIAWLDDPSAGKDARRLFFHPEFKANPQPAAASMR